MGEEMMETTAEPLTYDRYIENMTMIRQLSSPRIDEEDNAEQYSKRLRDNFSLIGKLAMENRELLDKILFPLLQREEMLTDEEVAKLREFGMRLFSDETYGMGELDLPIMIRVTERLMDDANCKHDIHQLIQQMKLEMYACYGQMYKTLHLRLYPEFTVPYREKAERVAEMMMGYLDHEKFLTLESPGERGTVLNLLRYMAAFYVPVPGDPDLIENVFRCLTGCLKLHRIPFFMMRSPAFRGKHLYSGRMSIISLLRNAAISMVARRNNYPGSRTGRKNLKNCWNSRHFKKFPERNLRRFIAFEAESWRAAFPKISSPRLFTRCTWIANRMISAW